MFGECLCDFSEDKSHREDALALSRLLDLMNQAHLLEIGKLKRSLSGTKESGNGVDAGVQRTLESNAEIYSTLLEGLANLEPANQGARQLFLDSLPQGDERVRIEKAFQHSEERDKLQASLVSSWDSVVAFYNEPGFEKLGENQQIILSAKTLVYAQMAMHRIQSIFEADKDKAAHKQYEAWRSYYKSI